MNLTSSKYRRILVLCAVVALACSGASAQTSGAIFTSLPVNGASQPTLVPGDLSGWVVNANTQYPGKEYVFLNGGPRNASSAGLSPVGVYYFQVTDPSGANLLSTDEAVCRQVVVALVGGKGRIAGVAQGSIDAGCAHLTIGTDAANGGATPVQLVPFDDTPNNGGEYKVWLIPAGNVTGGGQLGDGPVLEFGQAGVKTDNFKVLLGSDECVEGVFTDDCPPSSWPLEGRKFYDTNGDGLLSEGEPLIEGWRVRGIGNNPIICTSGAPESCDEENPVVPEQNYPDAEGNYYTAVVETDEFGKYEFAKLTVGGTYGVCEIMPTGGTFPAGAAWVATTVRPANSVPGGASWESRIYCPRHIVDPTNEFTGDQLNEFSCASFENDPLYSETPYFALFDLVNILPGRGPADFGNRCEGGDGRTIGFWGNRNGEAVFNSIGGLAIVNGIVDKQKLSGCQGNFANHGAFARWLRDANASNMAYMLSAQLAAMKLNLAAGFISGDATIEGYESLGTINQIVAAAEAALDALSCQAVLAGHAQRATLEQLKNALDKGNNSGNFAAGEDGIVHAPGACPVTYAGTEDCSAADAQAVTDGVDLGIKLPPPPQP